MSDWEKKKHGNILFKDPVIPPDIKEMYKQFVSLIKDVNKQVGKGMDCNKTKDENIRKKLKRDLEKSIITLII